MTTIRDALEELHQHPNLVNGDYRYQCGFLDCLELAKIITALEAQQFPASLSPKPDDLVPPVRTKVVGDAQTAVMNEHDEPVDAQERGDKCTCKGIAKDPETVFAHKSVVDKLTSKENAVDVNKLKMRNQYPFPYCTGWNDCVDHLAAQGHLSAKVPFIEGLDVALVRYSPFVYGVKHPQSINDYNSICKAATEYAKRMEKKDE